MSLKCYIPICMIAIDRPNSHHYIICVFEQMQVCYVLVNTDQSMHVKWHEIKEPVLATISKLLVSSKGLFIQYNLTFEIKFPGFGLHCRGSAIAKKKYYI